jgi:hypothetical protein
VNSFISQVLGFGYQYHRTLISSIE